MTDRPDAGDRMRVLVSPDKFKGTLSGPAAAEAMAAGVRQALPQADLTLIPLADGGEGTVEAVLATGARELVATVAGPLGEPVTARLALLGATAVIEAAQACGLQLISPTAQTALGASSAGVGELIRQAWDAGATRIVVGLGGVACTDGGAGLASALGVRLLDEAGSPVGPGELHRVSTLDLSGLDPRVEATTFVAATDVTNPLLGPTGAAAVYGPQKGAGAEELLLLEQGLTTLADAAEAQVGQRLRDLPGAGAAGGLGWGMVTFLGASIKPGGDLVMDLVGLPSALGQADMVLTGEGKLDAQSAFGKGPVALAELASRHGLQTVAVAGTVDPEGRAGTTFAAVWSLVEELGDHAALHDTAASLTEVTARAVNALRL